VRLARFPRRQACSEDRYLGKILVDPSWALLLVVSREGMDIDAFAENFKELTMERPSDKVFSETGVMS